MDILSRKKKNEKHFYHTSPSEIILNWETKEFSYHEKSRLWFLVGGIIFFIVVGYFTYEKQLIPALTFLLLGITIYIFSFKKPREINCIVTRQAVMVDNTIYSFKEISSFWIFYEPPDFKVISLKHKKPYLPYIQIPIGEKDPMEVRRALLDYLPEEEQEEPFSDKLARYLRF